MVCTILMPKSGVRKFKTSLASLNFYYQVRTHFARPNWKKVFSKMCSKHCNGRIGQLISIKHIVVVIRNFLLFYNVIIWTSQVNLWHCMQFYFSLTFFIFFYNAYLKNILSFLFSLFPFYWHYGYHGSAQGYFIVVHQFWPKNLASSASSSMKRVQQNLSSTRSISKEFGRS